MRPVHFVRYYDKGSTVMGADQISEALRAAGVESRAIDPGDLGSISDAVLIFIKTSRLDHLVRAARRRNRLVLDVQDTVVFKRRIKNARLYDGMIFRNARQLSDFGSTRRLDRLIYHQWDARYRPNRRPSGGLRAGYFGLERSFPYWNQVPGVDCHTPDGHTFPDEFFARAQDYNCHVSVRVAPREFLYKPNTKVSTAAACDAVLVTTPDASALELLGADYPYFTASDLSSVIAGVTRARETFGGDLWHDALARLRTVKARTSLDVVRDAYLQYVRDLG